MYTMQREFHRDIVISVFERKYRDWNIQGAVQRFFSLTNDAAFRAFNLRGVDRARG